MIKLLMTSVGSWVSQNVLDVIDARPEDFCIVGTTSLAEIPLGRCDRVYLVPPTERPPSAFCQRLLEIIDREKPDLVIPNRDHDATVLAALAAEYPPLLDLIPCGTPETALLLEDKWLSYVFAQEHGLLFAECALPDAASDHKAVYELVEKVGFPLIVKPRCGFASRAVHVVINREQLAAAVAEEGAVVQRYVGDVRAVAEFARDLGRGGLPLFYSLEQDKFSLQTYVRRDGSVAPVCTTIHRMRRGHSIEVERVFEEDLAAAGRRWAEALAAAGWRGPTNVQCQREDGGDLVAFELSGRFTGATAGRYFWGHDELGYFLEDRLDQRLGQVNTLADSMAIKYTRTVGVSTVAVEALSRDHVWERQAAKR
jgi:carbamoyl-phosphate synthase large subunit